MLETKGSPLWVSTVGVKSPLLREFLSECPKFRARNRSHVVLSGMHDKQALGNTPSSLSKGPMPGNIGQNT